MERHQHRDTGGFPGDGAARSACPGSSAGAHRTVCGTDCDGAADDRRATARARSAPDGARRRRTRPRRTCPRVRGSCPMTWANRLKMAGGILVVVVLVAVFTVVFNQRQQRVLSTSATIVAESYSVGTDYGGIVTRQYVEVGDEVSVGQPLFDVRSLHLQRDIASGQVADPALAAGVSADGTSTIAATVDGTVREIAVPQGGFAQAGGMLATVDENASLFVEAEFQLSARDYARIDEGNDVELLLPNQAVLPGAVVGIEVTTVDGQALSTVRIESAELSDKRATGMFQAGTPVQATLQLRQDGPLAGVGDAVRDLLRKVGL
ncbi:HlyD family efflux transporter periplasmic adaptor subunit [Microbacterium lushaniae]|nr:HlyD family efflux transporter periplasmic adaptor subunit [Microbacterium lushaniae]KAA9156082.1 HlyD family efflux transporter periplasmic adaptor subunit [Microbacterium lushaniae]